MERKKKGPVNFFFNFHLIITILTYNGLCYPFIGCNVLTNQNYRISIPHGKIHTKYLIAKVISDINIEFREVHDDCYQFLILLFYCIAYLCIKKKLI